MRTISRGSRFMVLAVCLVFVLYLPIGAAERNVQTGGIIIHNSLADFKKGIFSNTAVIDRGLGVIELARNEAGLYEISGTYESPEVYTEPFERMVLSWNTDTPHWTSVKIEAQVRVSGDWSSWLLVGTWSTWGDKGSAMSQEQASDDIANVDVDVVTVKGQGNTADAYRYRLTLHTENQDVTPAVRLVSATLRSSQGFPKIYDVTTQNNLDNFTGTLPVKSYSQTTRDPQFNMIICSPVSAAMVLDYKGVHILPEMAAMGVLDTYYNGYGNWSFNAAFIGSFGFKSYIEYCAGLDDIKMELMNGNPVICSVRYKQSPDINVNLPVISNAPIERTFGHLLVVVGYELGDDGKYYVVVNDPAALTDGEVRRYYEESQFMAAWNASGRIAYKTYGLAEGGGTSAPAVEKAELKATGREKTEGNVVYKEYMVYSKTDGYISAARAVSPHNSNIQSGVTILVWDEGAGAVHSYVAPTHDSGIWLTNEQAGMAVYLFTKLGGYYRAER